MAEPTDEDKKKSATDVFMSMTYLRFFRKHKVAPGIMIISQDIIDTICTKEKQSKFKGFTYFGVNVVVDETLPKGSCEALWVQ